MRTVNSIIAKLGEPGGSPLPPPTYLSQENAGRVGLAVESMKRHTSDEGWQIFAGLEAAGYKICGHLLPTNETDIPHILSVFSPGTLVVQDRREWDINPRDYRDRFSKFTHIERLKKHPEVFKVAVLKDAHQRPNWYKEGAEEVDLHGWVVYYHPRIVKHLAPYVREKHLIRTYHSIDANLVPLSSQERTGGVVSGFSLPAVYPMRLRMMAGHNKLPQMTCIGHPGYHKDGSLTPTYLKLLSRFKVSICTSSIYGYSLRKIVESVACGCRVITDLPSDDVLPEIDENLVRVDSNITVEEMAKLLHTLYREYDPYIQQRYARKAMDFYDYRAVGRRLATDIERLRSNYDRRNNS